MGEIKTVMIIAGEASGDTLGAELVRGLKRECAELKFFGAGGNKLEEAGVELAFDLSVHAVVGIWEVLKNYRKFKGFFDQLIALAEKQKPEVIVLIDYPGFNLRFARAIRERTRGKKWQPKVVYYVSPQIWAWHESRVHQIARDVDLMLSIFPFEKEWYGARRPELRVEYVGHPLIDRFSATDASPVQHMGEEVLLLLPGSRERELRKHLPVMLGAAQRLKQGRNLKIRMIVPSEKLKELAGQFGNLSGVEVQVGGLDAGLRNATVAIASSGTVTMECAYFGVPTVVIYKTSASTYFLGRRFIKVKYLAMPNLLADREIYPELIQEAACADRIEQAAGDLLNNPERQNVIKTQLHQIIAALGKPGASGRAAQAILSLE